MTLTLIEQKMYFFGVYLLPFSFKQRLFPMSVNKPISTVDCQKLYQTLLHML